MKFTDDMSLLFKQGLKVLVKEHFVAIFFFHFTYTKLWLNHCWHIVLFMPSHNNVSIHEVVVVVIKLNCFVFWWTLNQIFGPLKAFWQSIRVRMVVIKLYNNRYSMKLFICLTCDGSNSHSIALLVACEFLVWGLKFSLSKPLKTIQNGKL